jgi:hypothetical protein
MSINQKNMEAIKTYQLPNNRTLKIFTDENPDTPRSWDNLTKLVFFGKYRHLGDKHSVDNSKCSSWNDVYCEIMRHYGRRNIAFIRKVYAYVHSGMTVSLKPFSCQWDSGVLGFQVVLLDDIRNNWNIKRVTTHFRESAIAIGEGEIKVLDQYVSGSVYGFRIEDENENEEDSCWGFYGDDIEENGILDHVSDEDKAEVLKQV